MDNNNSELAFMVKKVSDLEYLVTFGSNSSKESKETVLDELLVGVFQCSVAMYNADDDIYSVKFKDLSFLQAFNQFLIAASSGPVLKFGLN